jgi:hypothetical protein
MDAASMMEDSMMNESRQPRIGFSAAVCVLVLLAVSAPGTPDDPLEEAESSQEVPIKCEAGHQTVRVSPLTSRAELRASQGCQCFWSSEEAAAWMQMWTRQELGPLRVHTMVLHLPPSVDVEPGEQKDVTFFCYSAEQRAAYAETLHELQSGDASSPSE